MPITTLYCRSDTHTVNNVTGYILDTTNSSSNDNIDSGAKIGASPGPPGQDMGYYYVSSISIIHADGSETSLDSGTLAQTTHGPTYNEDSQTVESATWGCPSTSLLSTDAIKIVWATYGLNGRIGYTPNWPQTRIWISNQLGWSKLNSATWTLYRYYRFYALTEGLVNPPYYYGQRVETWIYYGDSTYTTYIAGIDYSADVNLNVVVQNLTSVSQVSNTAISSLPSNNNIISSCYQPSANIQTPNYNFNASVLSLSFAIQGILSGNVLVLLSQSIASSLIATAIDESPAISVQGLSSTQCSVSLSESASLLTHGLTTISQSLNVNSNINTAAGTITSSLISQAAINVGASISQQTVTSAAQSPSQAVNILLPQQSISLEACGALLTSAIYPLTEGLMAASCDPFTAMGPSMNVPTLSLSSAYCDPALRESVAAIDQDLSLVAYQPFTNGGEIESISMSFVLYEPALSINTTISAQNLSSGAQSIFLAENIQFSLQTMQSATQVPTLGYGINAPQSTLSLEANVPSLSNNYTPSTQDLSSIAQAFFGEGINVSQQNISSNVDAPSQSVNFSPTELSLSSAVGGILLIVNTLPYSLNITSGLQSIDEGEIEIEGLINQLTLSIPFVNAGRSCVRYDPGWNRIEHWLDGVLVTDIET